MIAANRIEPEDFIRSKLVGIVCGFVVATGILKMFGRREMSGYTVRLADGREEFIAEEDAELIHKSAVIWQRLIDERRTP